MKKILILIFLLFCSFSYADSSNVIDENLKKSSKEKQVKDCSEGFNRATFAFNQGLDRILFKPIASAYRKLPVPIKTGTGNVVTNLSNLATIPNNILQGDIKTAGINTARLVVNSTVGILGIFDVASALGFEDYQKEDYGQTLGVMGVKEGCYLVLPVLGPSSSRDAIGTIISFMGGDPWYNITVKNDTQYFHERDYYISAGTSGVDFRAKNIDTFENLENNSMDFYASVKSLYLQNREAKIQNSTKIIDTQNDSDWEEIENQ